MRIGRVVGIVFAALILLVLGLFVYAAFSLKRTAALRRSPTIRARAVRI